MNPNFNDNIENLNLILVPISYSFKLGQNILQTNTSNKTSTDTCPQMQKCDGEYKGCPNPTLNKTFILVKFLRYVISHHLIIVL